MGFITDNQTLEDLKLIGRAGAPSIFGLFNRTATRGGAELLEELFRYPLSDPEAINGRVARIRRFAAEKTVFPFDAELFDIAEQYLSATDERTKLAPEEHSLGGKISQLIGADTEFQEISKGVGAIARIGRELRAFIGDGPAMGRSSGRMAHDGSGAVAHDDPRELIALLADPDLAAIWAERPDARLPYAKVAAYDLLLRFRHRDAIRRILRYIYRMDAYISVAKVATERGFCFPEALSGGRQGLGLEGLYHPELKQPVPNTLRLTEDENVLFLTGANMAGKSTFMKSLGIAVYLGHMGFPVPASAMVFSVFDGLYTTINLPDDLGTGTSHFYAEVLRVKKVARELGAGKNLFVIFDELFRGTNVKDACEATIAITSAFARRRRSLFVVSTHIMEAGDVLRENCPSVSFQYLPTLLKGNTPVYTYTLEKGITADRHGMVIIRNEGILDILKNGKKPAS